MITGLAIKNFKSLAQIPTDAREVSFGPLNVLIGPNGCGKSSLLQAIDFLRAFFESSVEVYLRDRDWDFKDLPNLRQTGKTIRWDVIAELDDGEGDEWAGVYRYSVALQPKRHLGIGEERLVWTPKHDKAAATPVRLLERHGRKCTVKDQLTGTMETSQMVSLPASLMSRWDPVSDRKRYPQALRFRDWVERFRSYLIWDPKVLRYPDRGKHDQLGTSGEHLASVIGRLKDKHPDKFQQLVKRLRRLFPNLTDISVSGKGWGWRSIRLHEGNGKEVVFNSQQMSDGVLRLIAVTGLLYQDNVPSVVTLEEPENGVHPQLIREVVQVLRELTLRKPPHQCQVFFTTHSPYILDEFYDHPEQVYCMDRPGPQAGARILRLSENRQLRLAEETFSKALGEAWVAGLLGATAGARGL